MATLTLKGIPDELLDRLRRRARLHRRSLNSEALVALEDWVGPTPVNPAELLERIRKHRSEMKFTLTEEMIDEAINEGRT